MILYNASQKRKYRLTLELWTDNQHHVHCPYVFCWVAHIKLKKKNFYYTYILFFADIPNWEMTSTVIPVKATWQVEQYTIFITASIVWFAGRPSGVLYFRLIADPSPFSFLQLILCSHPVILCNDFCSICLKRENKNILKQHLRIPLRVDIFC